jgi:hypothetical protein
MNEQELRTMIRDSIARHTGGTGAPARAAAPDPVSAFNAHVSHRRLPIARGGDEDGACIIEPSVRCNHCGYCQSLGH